MTHIITLSLLIVAVIIVRGLFRKHISPCVMYGLWLVVVLKLCIPFSLFDVEIPEIKIDCNLTSAEDSAALISPDKGTAVDPDSGGESITDGSTASGTGMETVIPELPSDLPEAGFDNDPIDNSPSDMASGTAAAGNIGEGTFPSSDADHGRDFPRSDLKIKDILVFAMGVGAAALGLLFALTGLIFAVNIRQDRRYIGKYRGIRVYISEKAETPCLHGLFPSVYLTPKAFESAGRDLILRHEYTHLRHGDNIWTALRTMALVVYWWNPLIWVAAILSRRDAEIAVDYSVTARLDEAHRIDYARTIIDMLPRKRSHVNGFANGSVKERIIMVTRKHKNRIFISVIAAVLVICAVSCSFVGFKEKSNPTYDTNEFFPEEESDTEHAAPEYFRVISKTDDIEVKHIVFENARSNHTPAKYAEDMYIHIIDRRNVSGEVEFCLVDMAEGKLISSVSVKEENFPGTVMYRNGICILYNMTYNTDKGEHELDCAYRITVKENQLYCDDIDLNKEDFEIFPYNGSFIESPDGRIRVYRVVDDGNGHGGIDVVYPDRKERIAENIMLDDPLGGRRAGLADVKGYTPYAFISDNEFVYRIGGWEWEWGYGIYNTDTGEKKEYLDGYGLCDIDAEGNRYISEVENYAYKNVWKVTGGGEKELVATMVEDGSDDAFKLYGRGLSLYYNNGYAHALYYDYGIRGEAESRKDITAVYTPDMKTCLAEIELDTEHGSSIVYFNGKILTVITYSYEAVESEISIENSD